MALLLLFSIVAAILIRQIYFIVYNLYYHPLSSFPGPKIGSATRLYEAYFEVLKKPGGQFVYEVDRLHKFYGPIVRIGPNELHVRDIDFVDILYASGAKRNKDPHQLQIFGLPLALFGSETYQDHKQRRSALSPYFSKASVTRLDPMIRQRVRQMCDRISEYGKNGRLLHIREAFVALNVDIVTEYSFSACVGALGAPDFLPAWEKMMCGVTEGIPLAKTLPGFVQAMQRLPLRVVRVLDPLMASYFDHMKFIREQVTIVRNRWANGLSPNSADTDKPSDRSIFYELLESSLPSHEKSEERLTQEGVGFISAAIETTSVVLATTSFHLLDNPEMITHLRAEVATMMPNPHIPVEWRKLESLPFLTAIVKEGLRITSTVSGRLPLIADEPLQYKDWTIPPNTSVSMSPRDALYNKKIFPEPARFNPDRWLHASDDKKRQMDKAFLPFNKGSRMCLGFHLAYANIYHTLTTLFMRFDLELVDTLRERDIDMVRDHFVAKPKRGSHGVIVRVSREF